MKHIWGGLSLVILCLSSAGANDADKATVNVYPNVSQGHVNKLIFGAALLAHNEKYYDTTSNRGAGIWDPDKNAPVGEYVALVKDAGISVFRWPGTGGRHTDALDWKRAIGPVESRPRQQFGLPEYLKFCADTGAIPLITVETSIGTPADAADLVEYLNSPNNGKNPNGGVDWAARRAKDGHNEPWNVTWFEFGNETFNTNMAVETYIQRYREYQAAMKAVDPGIKLGAVFEDSTNVDSGWTYSIMNSLKGNIDFGVIHPYVLQLEKGPAKSVPKETVALAAISADADFTYRLGRYRDLIKSTTGANALPLAVTEYNGLFTQEEPIPYRFTLLNALYIADNIRIMLDPEFHVALATYWQFSNGYWGMLQGYPSNGQKIIKEPNYYVLDLYHRHLGDTLVKLDISSGKIDFNGAIGISPRLGAPAARQSLAYNKPVPAEWTRRYFSSGDQSQDNGVVSVNFDKGTDTDYHHAVKEITVEPDTLYKISVRMRTIGIKGGKVGIEIQDSRGWAKTFSGAKNVSLTGTTPWTWVTTEYRTSADAKGIRILARRYPGSGAISGRTEFGEMRVEQIKENFGSVPVVNGIATVSQDKGKVYIVLINKDLHAPVDTTVNLDMSYEVTGAESLTGPSPYSTNLNLLKPGLVKISNVHIEKTNDASFRIILPAASLTGITLSKGAKQH